MRYLPSCVLAKPRDAHTLAPLGQEQSGRQRGPFGHILPILEGGYVIAPKGQQPLWAYIANTFHIQRGPKGINYQLTNFVNYFTNVIFILIYNILYITINFVY